MDISELIQTTSPTASAVREPSDDLGREEFLAMLIAQLENQDPLNPQDATEFTAQLAQFSSLEQLISMRSSIDSLADSQGVAQNLAAATLIGREALVATDSFSVSADPEQLPPRLYLDSSTSTLLQEVEIRDELGRVVARTSPLGALDAGRTELDWSEFGGAPPPGTYSVHPIAADGGPVPSVAVRARITGASLEAGSPLLVIGGVELPIGSLLEVNE